MRLTTAPGAFGPRRRQLLLLLLATAAVACTPGRTPDAAAHPDSGAATAAVPSAAPAVVVPAMVTPAVVAATTNAPSADVRAVCDSVATTWRSIARAKVRTVDTVTVARDVDADDQISYPACIVVAERDEGLDSTAQGRRFWPARGWTSIWKLDGDGPGASATTWQRDLLRCEVMEVTDPGDDGDTAYVPSPFFNETTTCWRHRFRVRVTDTLHVEP